MKTFLKSMAAPWQTIQVTELQIDNYLLENLHKNPKYDSPKKLNRYEFKVFSQAGEDGITSEMELATV